MWAKTAATQLEQNLERWLKAARETAAAEGTQLPVHGLKAVISPHAGYSYSGPAAGFAYGCIDASKLFVCLLCWRLLRNSDRVIILGPSHHKYIDGCALSRCAEYETPLGVLALDLEGIAALKETGKFTSMSTRVDEDEHSIEMQLPYIRKVFEKKPVKIIPILVGSINQSKEEEYGNLLAPYLADERTIFAISSDFCHWGLRFNYTYYCAQEDGQEAKQLTRSDRRLSGQPIHASIEALDRRGMAAASIAPQIQASEKHAEFCEYLKKTGNTICGRHPIGVLLATIASLQGSGAKDWTSPELEFIRYEQSSQCKSVQDSSVSYASAYLRITPS